MTIWLADELETMWKAVVSTTAGVPAQKLAAGNEESKEKPVSVKGSTTETRTQHHRNTKQEWLSDRHVMQYFNFEMVLRVNNITLSYVYIRHVFNRHKNKYI